MIVERMRKRSTMENAIVGYVSTSMHEISMRWMYKVSAEESDTTSYQYKQSEIWLFWSVGQAIRTREGSVVAVVFVMLGYRYRTPQYATASQV